MEMEARGASGGGLPVIDLSQDEETISRLIMDACTTFGFFYIKNHGVPQNLVDNLMAESRDSLQGLRHSRTKLT